MNILGIPLLFLGISLPLLFAGYIIVRSRKLLGTDFFRKSFWLGISLPLVYLVTMMALLKLSPDIYSSFSHLNNRWIPISYLDLFHIFAFIVIAISPWIMVWWIYSILWQPLLRVSLLSNIAASFLFLFLIIALVPLLQVAERFGMGIIIWSAMIVFLNALSEESNKVIFARIIWWEYPSWILLGGVIVALGFAFCENIFYTLIAYNETNSLSQVGNLLFMRTFFSLGIHMVSLFFALGLFLGAPKNIYFFHPRIILWFFFAIVFHTWANILLELDNNFSFIFLWLTLFLAISFGFYRIEKILTQKRDSIWQATL